MKNLSEDMAGFFKISSQKAEILWMIIAKDNHSQSDFV